MTFELSFTDLAAATDFFSTLSYTTLQVGDDTWRSAHGYNRDGLPIVTFARKHPSNRLTYIFTEMPRSAMTGYPTLRSAPISPG